MNYTSCMRVPTKYSLQQSGMGAYAHLQQQQYRMDVMNGGGHSKTKQKLLSQGFYYPPQVSQTLFQQEPLYCERRHHPESRQSTSKLSSYPKSSMSGNLAMLYD